MHISRWEKLFSFVPSKYDWLSKNEDIYETRIHSFNSKDEKLVARKTRFYKQRDTFSGGVIDPLKYTIVEIILEIENTNLLNDKTFFNDLSEHSNTLLVYFIDVYRAVSQNKTIHRPSVNQSPVVEFCVSEAGNIEGLMVEASLKCNPSTFTWNDPFKKGNARQPLSDKKTKLLAKMLQSGRELKIFEQLLLDSQEQAHINHNYDLCIVLAETAFEVYLQELLLETHIINNHRLLSDDEINNYEEAIKGSNIGILIKEHLKNLIGKNLAGSKEYTNWHKNTYTLRNDIIHKGSRNNSEKSAEKAFDSVAAFMKLIDGTIHEAKTQN